MTLPAGLLALGLVIESGAPIIDTNTDGSLRGMRIRPWASGQASDLVQIEPSALPALDWAIVLHAIQLPAGETVYRAYFTRDLASTLNTCLNSVGWHISLIVLNRLIQPVAGVITFRGQAWTCPEAIEADTAGDAVGAAASTPLVGAP